MDTQNQTNSNKAAVPVIRLTPSALEKIRNMMQKEGKEGSALRVGLTTGGCAGLSYDLRFQKNPYDNDIVLEQDGLKILINTDTVPLIQGLEINYIDTLKESGFQYKNPNAKSSCGCGTSFS